MVKTLNDTLQTLSRMGLRLTQQRIEVLRYLEENRGHPSAEEIYKALKDHVPGLSLTTVYNNLKLLTDYGVINELPFGEGLSRYEWKDAGHYHVICESCGTVVDFQYPHLKEIEELANQLSHFQIKGHNLQIYGLCQTCKTSNRGDSS